MQVLAIHVSACILIMGIARLTHINKEYDWRVQLLPKDNTVELSVFTLENPFNTSVECAVGWGVRSWMSLHCASCIDAINEHVIAVTCIYNLGVPKVISWVSLFRTVSASWLLAWIVFEGPNEYIRFQNHNFLWFLVDFWLLDSTHKFCSNIIMHKYTLGINHIQFLYIKLNNAQNLQKKLSPAKFPTICYAEIAWMSVQWKGIWDLL